MAGEASFEARSVHTVEKFARLVSLAIAGCKLAVGIFDFVSLVGSQTELFGVSITSALPEAFRFLRAAHRGPLNDIIYLEGSCILEG